MSILKKPYELSVWRDVWGADGITFEEQRLATIGSNVMTSQYRALEPKLKRKVNGSNELTFKMHRKFKDDVTGEEVTNPFVDLVVNEAKLKLKYKDKWYDFIVKNVSQDSNNATYTYTATDLHINELSKNGFNLVLDNSLMNNTGTVTELSNLVLQGTGWHSEGATLVQHIEEQLVEMSSPMGTVYAFYSSVKEQPERFQYLTRIDVIDEDGVVRNDAAQAFIMVGENNPYTTDKEAIKYGFYYPTGWKFEKIVPQRGDRIVYTHRSKFNPALNKIVYYYNNNTVAGYCDTEYITPNLIQNLVTNNTFKSTSGWTGAYATSEGAANNQGSLYNAKVTASTWPSDLISEFRAGTWSSATTYTPCLRVEFPNTTSRLVNSGFYDNRNFIKNLAPGQKFVLFYRETSGSKFTVNVAEIPYLVSAGHYISNSSDAKTYITFDTSASVPYTGDEEFSGYRYVIGTVVGDYNLTAKEFLKKKLQVFVNGNPGSKYCFLDFQIFEYVAVKEDQNEPLLPINAATEATAVTKYYYYSTTENPEETTAAGYKSSEKEYKYLDISDTPIASYTPVYITDRVRSISVKQSNYFNAIQSICEKFECWADFIIEHDAAGYVTKKTVVFKEFIGKENNAGFKNGINLKSTKRTLDSKAVVTKLIVPDGSNEFAPNGFCSISRAGSNPTGENYIYNFSYYINQGLLDGQRLDTILYNPIESLSINIDLDADVPYAEISGTTSVQGYYTKLLMLNQQLNNYIDNYTAVITPLMQAEADLQVAEAGRDASSEKYEDAVASFAKAAGFDYDKLTQVYYLDENGNPTAVVDPDEVKKRQELVDTDKTIKGYFTEIAEYYAAWQQYLEDVRVAQAQYEKYKLLSERYQFAIDALNNAKAELNLAFYKIFYRFIQEGTWKSDEYTDNEKYYIDAWTTSANSCLPKVSYTFNVLDLSQVEGYEAYDFELADKTWVEDPEFFGYKDGVPFREEVVITEVTYALDEPDKNTIKVQNYQDQFADLFQKVTATTQQVSYAAGVWQKSSSFTESEAPYQAAFLQDALGNADLVLQNAGEQSVVWDKSGITVTDLNSPNQQLRIVGGAILLRDEDADGLGWKTGITSKGISAKLLNAGQINTGLVQIMNGDEPYFRWDAYGITAYYFETDPNKKSNYLYGMDTKKGVRFDRFGIYGYNGVDGQTWHPDSLEELEDNALFALTWNGLFLNLGCAFYHKYYDYDAANDIFTVSNSGGTPKPFELAKPLWHSSTAKIGKTTDYIYNSWVTAPNSDLYGLPYYDPSKSPTQAPVFTKIFAVGGADGNEQLVIYDDGTLACKRVKLTGSVEWTAEASPSKTVYGKVSLTTAPPNGTKYKDFPENDGKGTPESPYVWHKVAEWDDTVYCHTDNAGAIWEGPFLITGRSIEKTIVEYVMEARGLEPNTIEDEKWSITFPTELIDGMCVYTRSYDIYNNGEKSSYRYSVGYIGTSNYRLSLDNDYASVPVANRIPGTDESLPDKLVDSDWHATANVTVYYGDEIDKGEWSFEVIPSAQQHGLTGTITSTGVLTIRPQTSGHLAGENHTVGIKATNMTKNAVLYTSFTAAKLHAGDDAISYHVTGYPAAIVRHVNTIGQYTPDDFVLQAHKQVGANEFEPCAGYWKYSINNNSDQEFLVDDSAKASVNVDVNSIIGTLSQDTLRQLTLYFYLKPEDTVPVDKEVIVVAEDGKDGTSFSGILELYYATQTDTEVLPEVDIYLPDGTTNTNSLWRKKVSETNYGKMEIEGDETTLYKFLWNREKILLSDDEKQGDYTDPELISTWALDGKEGRGIEQFVTYYTVNQSTLTPPHPQPEIVNNTITANGWTTGNESFTLQAGDCLWEKVFIKYSKPDENGNIYEGKLPAIVRAIPKTVYRIALTNDSGVVVTDKSGEGGVYGENVITSVVIYDGDEIATDKWTVVAQGSDLEFSESGTGADKVYSVTKLNADVGYITFVASLDGAPTMKTTFKASKLKQGEDGQASTAYWLTSSSATIPVRENGEYGRPSVVFTAMKQDGTNEPVEYTPYKFEIYVNNVLKNTVTNTSSVECELGAGKYEVTDSLTCKMYYNEQVVLDTQTAEVVRDGSSVSSLEVVNWYLATNVDSGVTTQTAGWTNKLADAQITVDKPYLWNYEVIASKNNSGAQLANISSEPSIIGVYGQTGPAGVGISAIADYYATNNNKLQEPDEWYNEDEASEGEMMPEPTPEAPYLWTYEKFTYSNGQVVSTKPRVISELSVSIETLKDYYIATAADTEPEPPKYENGVLVLGDWKKDHTKVGHSNETPWLWNVEVIEYNYGKENQISEVTLVTRLPRSVSHFVEYYQITNTAKQPDPIVLEADGNSIKDSTGWIKAEDEAPVLGQGQWLWNQELVVYTTKDNEQKNLCSLTSVQLMGYIGTSPYTINLSSDFASIPYSIEAYTNIEKVNENVFEWIDFEFEVFNGSKQLTLGTDYVIVAPGAKLSETEDKLQVLIECTNAKATWTTTSKEINAEYDTQIFTQDWVRGTIIVQLYEDGVKVASATYELSKQLGGADGSYEYLISTTPVVIKSTDENDVVTYEPSSIEFNLLKRVGDAEPILSTAKRYALVYFDDNPAVEKEFDEGVLTVAGDITKEIKVEVYSDAERKNIIDREVVPVIANGVDAYNTATLTLYRRSTSTLGDDDKPGQLSYDFGTKALTGTFNSWSQTPIEHTGDGSIGYKTVANIRNRLTTHVIEAADWSTPTIDDLPSTLVKELIVYKKVKAVEGTDVTPGKPGAANYNCTTDTLTFTNADGWSRTVPAAEEGYIRYFSEEIISGKEWEHSLTSDNWSTVQVYVEEGLRSETLTLYARPAGTEGTTSLALTVPTKPSDNVYTYNFVNKTLTGSATYWSTTEPTSNGYPLYITRAKVTSKAETCPVTSWSEPVIESTPAVQSCDITLFKLAEKDTNPAAPAATLKYSFANKTLTGELSGWSTDVPVRDTDAKKQLTCYEISTIASSIYPVEYITQGEWSAATVYLYNTTSEYLKVEPANIQGSYTEGSLVFTPSNISVSSYLETNGVETETFDRYITYKFDKTRDGSDSNAAELEFTDDFVLSGDPGAITFKLYSEAGGRLLDTKTVTLTYDAIHILRTEKRYLASSKKEDVTRSDAGWSPSPQNPTSVAPYVWTYDVLYYTDGKVEYTDPIRQTSEPTYLISLSNDSATIGAATDGTVNTSLLKTVSENTVTVWCGTTDVTTDCTITWTVSGGTLKNTSGSYTYLTAMSSDSATATATVYHGTVLVGSKEFVISKSKKGDTGNDAITYVIAVYPNSWNATDGDSLYPEAIVTKYIGNTATTPERGEYTVKANGSTWENGDYIEDTTIFDLYVGGNIVDSETVIAIYNGAPGAPGDTGDTGTKTEAVRIFTFNSTNSAPSLPSGNLIGSTTSGISQGIWTTAEMTADSSWPFVFTSTGTKTTTYSGTTVNTITYNADSWTTPELWSAYKAGVDPKAYAAFLTLTNGGSVDAFDYINGQLYINATYINSGYLAVSDGVSTLFEVSFDGGDNNSGSVYLAGWTVDDNSIRTGTLGSGGSMWLCRNGTTTSAEIGGSGKINGWSIAVSDNFGVTNGGALYATSANVTGTITTDYLTATGGTISNLLVTGKLYLRGGVTGSYLDSSYYISANINNTSWYIYLPCFRADDDKMYFGGGFGTGLAFFLNGSTSTTSIGGSSGSQKWQFTVGSVFGVTTGGDVYMNSAHVQGVVEADSGRIGPWSLSSSSLYSSYTVSNSAKYFGFNQSYYPIFAGATNSTGSGATFYISQSGYIYAISGSIGGWTLSSEALSNSYDIGTVNGYSGVYQSTKFYSDTLYLYVGQGAPLANPYKVCEYDIHWQYIALAGYIVYTNGGSDERLKFNIAEYDDRVEVFYDALKPRSFYYKEANRSKGIHYGFIAQEVLKARDFASLGEQEFAGVYQLPGSSAEDSVWMLSKEEFISLNTWQIQKLKPRMTAAEQEIEKLKLEIEELRAELEALR